MLLQKKTPLVKPQRGLKIRLFFDNPDKTLAEICLHQNANGL